MACNTCLVCLVSTVSGHLKNTLLKASASSGNKTKQAGYKADGLARQAG